MNFKFDRVPLEAVKEILAYNFGKSSYPIDSYFEDILKSARFHTIMKDTIKLGYFAMSEDHSLCSYWLAEEFRVYSSDIFSEIINQYSVKSALIPSGDVLFLSNALDSSSNIEKQACIFSDGHNHLIMPRPDLALTPATLDDFDLIRQSSEDFFDNLVEDLKAEKIYLAKSCDDLVGFGIIEKGYFLQNYASIGMFTVSKYRSQGIGATILILLKRLCYKIGYKPIAGCWYYNDVSKKTLKNAGFYSDTRLLRILF